MVIVTAGMISSLTCACCQFHLMSLLHCCPSHLWSPFEGCATPSRQKHMVIVTAGMISLLTCACCQSRLMSLFHCYASPEPKTPTTLKQSLPLLQTTWPPSLSRRGAVTTKWGLGLYSLIPGLIAIIPVFMGNCYPGRRSQEGATRTQPTRGVRKETMAAVTIFANPSIHRSSSTLLLKQARRKQFKKRVKKHSHLQSR